MDPGSSLSAQSTISPTGSRVSLPGLLGAGSSSNSQGSVTTFASFGLSGGLSSPPPPSADVVSKGDVKKEPSRIRDFRRFVTFAVRRDTTTG